MPPPRGRGTLEFVLGLLVREFAAELEKMDVDKREDAMVPRNSEAAYSN